MTAPVTLDYVRKHLNLDDADTADDVELQDVIDAAVELIEEFICPITPVDVTELHDGGGQQIVLDKFPVVTVTSVTDVLRNVVYTDDSTQPPYYVADSGILTLVSAGWSTHLSTGWSLTPRFGSGSKNIQVVYTAGRSVVPAKVQLAIAELVRHLWQTQQGSRMSSQAEDWSPAEGFAIPNRVFELLGDDERSPLVG